MCDGNGTEHHLKILYYQKKYKLKVKERKGKYKKGRFIFLLLWLFD